MIWLLHERRAALLGYWQKKCACCTMHPTCSISKVFDLTWIQREICVLTANFGLLSIKHIGSRPFSRHVLYNIHPEVKNDEYFYNGTSKQARNLGAMGFCSPPLPEDVLCLKKKRGENRGGENT